MVNGLAADFTLDFDRPLWFGSRTLPGYETLSALTAAQATLVDLWPIGMAFSECHHGLTTQAAVLVALHANAFYATEKIQWVVCTPYKQAEGEYQSYCRFALDGFRLNSSSLEAAFTQRPGTDGCMRWCIEIEPK